jgi:PKD repeat protein
MKKILCFIILVLTIFLICSRNISAYNNLFSDGVATHPEITQQIFDSFGEEFNLSQQEKYWILQGARDEDIPNVPLDLFTRAWWARFNRHFYAPQKGDIGFKGVFENAKYWATGFAGTGETIQRNWADDVLAELKGNPNLIGLPPSEWPRYIDDFSWTKAISYNMQYDSERTKAFVALGHILHLIQDMTVPAHVRDDFHWRKEWRKPPIYGDKLYSYEYYTENFCTFTPSMKEKIKLDGMTHFDFISQYIDTLAEYVSYNFFSPNTIGDDDQPDPEIGELEIDQENKARYLFREVDLGKYHLAKEGLLSGRFFGAVPQYFVIDSVCIEDYWGILGIKAVQYSAGAIQLFLDSTNFIPQPDNKPIANIDPPYEDVTIYQGESVEFQGHVLSGNPPFTFLWDFGGGADNSTEEDPGWIRFDYPGIYTVTFTVTDSDGDIDSDSVNIIVKEIPVDTEPIAELTKPPEDLTIYVDDPPIDFEGSVTGGNPPFTFFWEFDGGTPNSSEEKDPGKVSFSTEGTYLIKFYVTDADGDWDEDSVTVTVRARDPFIAKIDPTQDVITIYEGESVNFQGTVFGGNPPFTFLWDFGGGADNSTEEDPGLIRFDYPGIYTVTFTVTDNDWDQASDSMIVQVNLYNVSGTWVGTYSTGVISSAQVTYYLSQSGTNVSGTYFTSTGVGGEGEGIYSGTAAGDIITFTLNQTTPECLGAFSGTAYVSGNYMEFDFTGSDCGGYHANGHGSATRQ